MPSILVNDKATFLKRCNVDRSGLARQNNITSNPAEVVTNQTFLDTTPPEAPKIGFVKSLIDCARKNSPKDKPASEDEDIERWIDDNLPSAKRPRERVTSIVSISSTSSCDMHTNTDVSEDEMEHDVRPIQPSPAPVQKIIELILRKVEINLRNAAYKQCTGRSAAHSQAKSTLPSGQSSRKTSVSSGSKRKSRLEGSPPPEDDDEDGTSKRRRGSTTTTDESETGARFACPFYKHDPDRYRNRRTCPGPGWPTVHRMKEHLYRSHSQPIFCPICYATFKSDKEQSSHVRLQQCERSLPQQIEGIDRETIWTLRKRTTALRLEEDKWRDVYQVLFPNVSAAEIPSPCTLSRPARSFNLLTYRSVYDCDSPSETSRRFRRDLLRRVQEELLIEAGQVPTPVEQQLLQHVAQIVRRCEHDLLNQAQPPSTPSFNPDRRASASSINSSYQATPLPAATPAFQRPSLAVPSTMTGREHGYDSIVDPDAVPYIPEPTMEFGDVVWNDPPYVFGTGINWEAVFPPAPETQYLGSDEAATNFSVPMWT